MVLSKRPVLIEAFEKVSMNCKTLRQPNLFGSSVIAGEGGLAGAFLPKRHHASR
jgi:hypothetical protein|tara:strand:- start:947 stop:1108 length:162 start_codon:yes stop_codon:yes gene_type:complete